MAAQHRSPLPFFLTVAIFSLAGSTAFAEEPTTFGLRVFVADADGEPVVDQDWVDARIRWANRIFEPASVAFAQEARESLAEEHTDLVSRADRHALSPLIEGTRIHVFVVRSLANVDVDGDFIRGVHWRSRRGGAGPGGNRRHYVILSSIAGPTVLAHELGHFFGNPHSPTPGNIMSYTRGSGPPFFDDQQLRRIRRHEERFLRTEELVAIEPRG